MVSDYCPILSSLPWVMQPDKVVAMNVVLIPNVAIYIHKISLDGETIYISIY